jgi:hypothetical protein
MPGPELMPRPGQRQSLDRQQFLGRRQLLGAAALAVAGPPIQPVMSQPAPSGAGTPLPVPPGGGVAFRIMRNGERIGTHDVRFAGNAAAALSVSVAVEIVVRFVMVPVFRYTHHVTEHWQAGRLMEFVAETDHDGSPQHASGRRDPAMGAAAGLVVEGTKATVDYKPGRYVAPPASILGTHWNRHELDAPIINPETGRLDRPAIGDGGEVAVMLADGTTIPARRFVLTGDVHLELFYARDGQWAGLSFSGDDGSLVKYERL